MNNNEASKLIIKKMLNNIDRDRFRVKDFVIGQEYKILSLISKETGNGTYYTTKNISEEDRNIDLNVRWEDGTEEMARLSRYSEFIRVK